MTQVISKTGQKNNQFGTWTDEIGYKAGDSVVYEGSIYTANSDIPPGTSFVQGTVGPTWAQVVAGGGTASEIGAGTPGNVIVDADGIVTISAEGTANVVTVDANGMSLIGNLTLTGPEALNIPGSPGAGSILSTDANGKFEWSSLANAVGNSITTNGLTTAGNITTTGSVTANTVTATGNITSNDTISGNAINSNTTITANGNITSNGTVSGNAGNFGTLTVTTGANLGNVANLTILGGSNGQFLQTDGTGVLTWANAGGDISNGTSGITTNASNVTMVVDGNTIQVVDANGTTTTGNANVTGNITANGNVTAGNITTNGAITTQTLYSNTTIMANGNIMSNGAVIGNVLQGNTANIAGNLTAGNITTDGTVTSNALVANTITGGNISGNGAGLTNITGANVVGNVPSAIIANFANFAGNVTVSAQPNITSLGTLTGLSIGGDIIPDADEVYDLGNATHKFRDLWLSGATLRLGNASLSSNGGNIVMSTVVANTVNANLFNGNGSGLTNINGANVIGTVPVSNFANFAGNVTVNAQPNITSLGTLTGLTVNGISTLGPNANVKITGGTTGQLLATDGDGNLIWTTVSTSGASNGTSGTQVNASNVTTVIGGNVIEVIGANGTTITGNANVSNNITAGGNITGNYIIGNGSQLTQLNGANVTGTVANANFAAYAGNVTVNAQANITSLGTLTSLTVAGNSTLGSNANVRITGGSNGQALFTDGAGNLNWTTVTANAIFNGNSNVAIPAANGNVNISAAGNANVVVVTGTGLNVTGTTTLGNTLTISTGGAQITGDMSINGNFNVIGNVNYNNVSQLVIGDPLLFIASNNATDVVDSGLVSTYNSNKYTGIARNRLTNTWTVFNNLNTIPTSTIDWANAPLGSFASGNTTVTGFTANGLVTLGTVANVRINGGSSGQLLSTDGAGTLTWVSVSGGANFIANGVSNLQFTGSGGNLIGAVDGSANSFFLSPIVFSAKSLSVLLGAGNASTMTPGVDYRVAVGYQAGDSSQSTNTVAIGNAAGKSSQAANAVAIGTSAGQTSQLTGAIAIGSGAGRVSQGANAVAIGQNAGATNQHANTIILNASGANLDSVQANSFLVSSVRNDTAANVVFYNPTTKEVTYGSPAALSPTSIVNGTSNIGIPVANGGIVAFVGPNPAINIPGGFDGRIHIGMNANGGSRTTSVGWCAGDGLGGTSANSVFVGYQAGALWSASNIVAIGHGVAGGTVDEGVIVIGHEASRSTNIGANSIIIGAKALVSPSVVPPRTIVLNATGIGLTTTATANSFYVNPIRNDTGNVTNYMFYNATTKEVTYGSPAIAAATANFANFAGNITVNAQPNITSVGTLTGITVSGTANLGAVGNVKVTGGSTGQVLQTDGNGNLTWANSSLSSIVNGNSFISVGNASGNITGNIFGERALYIGGGFPSAPGNIAIGQEAGNSNQSDNTVAIGKQAGRSFQASQAVAIGSSAGFTDQRTAAIAIGSSAGSSNQGQFAIAIGQSSAGSGQGNGAISIGRQATTNNQGANSIAIGISAAGANQSVNSIVFNATGSAITANTANAFYVAPIRNSTAANVVFYDPTTKEMTYGTSPTGQATSIANGTSNIGFSGTDGNLLGFIAGTKSLDVRFDGVGLGFFATPVQDGVAIGSRAVANVNSVSVGANAGFGQNIGPNSVTIGGHAGHRTSASNVVMVGSNSGMFTSGSGAVVIGSHSAQNAAGTNSVAIGFRAVANSSGNNSIVLNASGTAITASANSLYVDPVRNATAGNVVYYDITTKEMTYGTAGAATSIAAGSSNIAFTGANSNITGYVDNIKHLQISYWQTYMGRFAGVNSSNNQTIGIGLFAGQTNQQLNGTAIGTGAGQTGQGDGAIALGTLAGNVNQSANAIAIGYNAGTNAQGANAIAIGFNAGNLSQGIGAIAIGNGAGNASQHANSIIISATGALNSAGANRLYIDPVRNATTANVMYYDTTTKEVTHGAMTAGTNIANGNSNVVVDANSTVRISSTGTANVVTVGASGMTITGQTTMGPVNEALFGLISPGPTLNLDCALRTIFRVEFMNQNPTAVITNLTTPVASATVVTLFLFQNNVPYMPTVLTIAGATQTIRWQGGVVPTGNVNKLDVVAFTILRTGASTYVVTGQMVSYG